MSQVMETIEVDVPVTVAYNQWTQFEEFPEFMDGVEEVRQLDETHLHWVASIAGVRREWDAEIVEQANSRRSYEVRAVQPSNMGEQQRIADAFLSEKLLPRRVEALNVPLFKPGA